MFNTFQWYSPFDPFSAKSYAKRIYHEFPGSCYIKVDWEKYALFPFSILKISSSFIGYEAAYFHIRGNILYGSFHCICNITPFTYFFFKIRRWRGSKPAQITCRDTFAHSFHHNLIAFIRQALSSQLNSKFLQKEKNKKIVWFAYACSKAGVWLKRKHWKQIGTYIESWIDWHKLDTLARIKNESGWDE